MLDVTNNTAEATTGFTVDLDTNAPIVYTSWNGTFSDVSGEVSIDACCAWNGALAAGATDSSIGFCANRDGAGSGTMPVVLGSSATF